MAEHFAPDERDHHDHGQHWAGIAEAQQEEATYLPHAEAWETVTSPPDMYSKPSVEPPLGYPGRAEQTHPAPGAMVPIEVHVTHAIDTHERVPDRMAAMSVTVPLTPIRLVGVNRRRQGLLINPSVAIVIGDANITATNGLTLVANSPFSVTTTDEVWALATTTAGRVDVLQTWHDVL